MEEKLLPQLDAPYNLLLEQGRIDEYVTNLAADGPGWWFAMEVPRIAVHLAPLASMGEMSAMAPRLLLLAEVTKSLDGYMSVENLDGLFLHLADEGDLEAAAVAAAAGVASIWDSGIDFDRYGLWRERITTILGSDGEISPLATASLFGFKALVEMTGTGDLSAATESFESQLIWAERAKSPSLRLFHAAAFSYCLLWQGRLSRVAVLLADGAPLAALSETSILCRLYYMITCGLFCAISGRVEEGRRMLEEVVGNPLFEKLSPPVFYLCYGNLLYALSHGGLNDEIEKIADKLRRRTVLEQCAFHHSYMHFNLGIAYLRTGQPHEALVYSEEAITRGNMSGSPIAERMPALLKGQALADLGREREALEHLTAWLERWSEAEYNILASAGAIEVSAIMAGIGEIDRAREYYEKASAFMPTGEGISVLYRPTEFLEQLQRTLFPSSREAARNLAVSGGALVRIETFGGLRIHVGSKTLYDRRWRGARSKMLLKAIIVYGGTKVPTGRLADAIWPDLDGDRAMKNLKVAITRLRRVGSREGERPLHWIVVRHKQVSLASSLCTVDSILFQEALKRAIRERDMESLAEALDLYTGDFLPHDLEEPWIIRQREALKNDFINGALLLADLAVKGERSHEAVVCLKKAVEIDPLHEGIYVRLMKLHIAMGYPSRALQTFHDARSALKAGLAIEPGPTLVAIAHKIGGGH